MQIVCLKTYFKKDQDMLFKVFSNWLILKKKNKFEELMAKSL